MFICASAPVILARITVISDEKVKLRWVRSFTGGLDMLMLTEDTLVYPHVWISIVLATFMQFA